MSSCRFVPSLPTSQSFQSTMNRTRFWSGEILRNDGDPDRYVSFLEFEPSASASQISCSFEKAICFPSGKQTGTRALRFPSLRGVPLGKGSTQACGSLSVTGVEVTMNSPELSGAMSDITKFEEGVGMAEVS